MELVLTVSSKNKVSSSVVRFRLNLSRLGLVVSLIYSLTCCALISGMATTGLEDMSRTVVALIER